MKRGFKEIQAQSPDSPDDTATITALIPDELISIYFKTKLVKVYNLETAKHVLELPERIYHGVREYNEGGWCYVGRPEQYAIRPRVWVPLPDHLIFAVYLNPSYHVYEWRLEKVSDNDPLAPLDHENRYGELSWQRKPLS